MQNIVVFLDVLYGLSAVLCDMLETARSLSLVWSRIMALRLLTNSVNGVYGR